MPGPSYYAEAFSPLPGRCFRMGISHSTVARVWAEHEVKPWRVETFTFSTDPELEAKVRDVVGLYLDPPAHAIVLCAVLLDQGGRAAPGQV